MVDFRQAAAPGVGGDDPHDAGRDLRAGPPWAADIYYTNDII